MVSRYWIHFGESTDSVGQDRAPKLKPLPQIVIVADEFADMIMQVGKQAGGVDYPFGAKSRRRDSFDFGDPFSDWLLVWLK